MSYNNIILSGLLLLLLGCAATPPTQPPHQAQTQKYQTQNEVDTDIATYALAIADIRLDKLDKARTLLKNLTDKHPELAGPWANLALINIKEKNFDQARANLKIAVKRNPSMPQAYNMLGYIDKQEGKITQAIKDYQKAISQKPDYALAHYNLALIYDIYLQDVPQAVDNYKRYLTLTNYQDKRTANWVKELESSIKQGKP